MSRSVITAPADPSRGWFPVPPWPPPANPSPDDLPTPKGPIDFGVTGAEFLGWIYMGTNDFAKDPGKPQKQLRMIANIGEATFLVVGVKSDLGITDLHDIAEKRLPVKIIRRHIHRRSHRPKSSTITASLRKRVKSFGGALQRGWTRGPRETSSSASRASPRGLANSTCSTKRLRSINA